MCRPSTNTTSVDYALKTSVKNKRLINTKIAQDNTFLILVVLPLLSYISFKFSSILPSLFSPNNAHLYYISANWHYTDIHCRFCNSIWTWGTDYLIAVFMAQNAISCLQRSKITSAKSSSLRRTTAILFALYCISVLSGGIAHQYYTKVEEMNTFSFRMLWFICVGCVGMSGGIIGIMGSQFGISHNIEKGNILPDIFWKGYGLIMVLLILLGHMSYQRPACDIFIAGTTQCAPTFYNIWIMFNIYSKKQQIANAQQLTVKQHSLEKYLKYTFSYLLNCPPLPIYTILLHAQIPTSMINTYLHANLFLTWNCQGYFIRYFIDLLEEGV